MATRWYLLPIMSVTLENGATARGPAYLRWRDNPDGLDVPWGMMDYGLMPVALAAADVTTEQHAVLVANADVIAAPANIDNTIGAGALTQVRAAVESLRIPANWAQSTHTYRQVLRTVAGLFQVAQRYHGRHGKRLLPDGVTLDDEFRNLPAAMRTELIDVADSLGIDRSGATGATTLRVILRVFADSFQGRTFNVGGIEL